MAFKPYKNLSVFVVQQQQLVMVTPDDLVMCVVFFFRSIRGITTCTVCNKNEHVSATEAPADEKRRVFSRDHNHNNLIHKSDKK